jgi:ABC-type phosphate transport system substrate-binding protein
MNRPSSSTISLSFRVDCGRTRVLGQRYLRVFIFVLLAASLASARDIALVSNKSNALGAITIPDLVKVCKAQTNRWPDGKPVTFVMRSPSAPEMKTVLEKIYGMSESELSSLIVTSNHGRQNHPAILIATSDEDLVNKVASTPGAVGVVDVYSINSSVAVVKVGGKLPLEPGYLLHGN